MMAQFNSFWDKKIKKEAELRLHAKARLPRHGQRRRRKITSASIAANNRAQ